jgi:hypothetical protein
MDGNEKYRFEWKYFLSLPQAELLAGRVKQHLQPDPHAVGGSYTVRSLYFDDWKNSAYEQKLMGVYARQKWRVRIYNYSDDRISLERKKKRGNYIFKESASLSREEFGQILAGDFGFLLRRQENLCREFWVECTSALLRPKVIVDYRRTPLILKEGTVRLTFDEDVRAAVGSFDIFDPDLPVISAQEPDKVLLEVKYTEFLPRFIQQLLSDGAKEYRSFSKYVACYEAARHLTNLSAGIGKSRLFMED